MSTAQLQQAEAPPVQAEALLAGVLAAAKAALPQGLDLLVWGAARLGDQATLRHLLANGGGTSWTYPMDGEEQWRGRSCLWMASSSGHEGAVRELLESGVDVDEAMTDDGITPLYDAAFHGHERVVEQLLKGGADVDKAVSTSGFTPLYVAAFQGHEGIIEQLLKAGADVNKACTDDGSTPLYVAASQGREIVIEQLVKAGADVDRPHTDDGATPLWSAAFQGHDDVVETLVNAGADVNRACTDDGSTPLHAAASYGHEGVIEVLLKGGADPNAEMDDGDSTPLILAAAEGHSKVCSILLEAGANVNHVTNDQRTALRVAVTCGCREVALVLMKNGASCDGAILTREEVEEVTVWSTEALKEKEKAMEEKDAQMERLVQGIPEWCAQAASAQVSSEWRQQQGGNRTGTPDARQPVNGIKSSGDGSGALR